MASDFLTSLAKSKAQKIDQQFGPNAYGGTKFLTSSTPAGAQAPASPSRDWSFFEQERGSSPARSEAGTASPKLGSIRFPSANKTASGNVRTSTLDRYAEKAAYDDNIQSLKSRLATLQEEKSRLEAGLALDMVAPVQNEIEQIQRILRYDGKEYDDNFFGQFGASYAQGRLSQDEAYGWNAYLGNPTPDAKQYAENISSALREFQIRNKDALDEDAVLPAISQDLAGYLPQFVDQTKARVAGGAAGAAAGALIPVVGIPNGIRAGAIAGSSIDMYNLTRGYAFKALVDEGVDVDTARSLAGDEAFLSSILEAGDTMMDMATLGVNGIIKNAAKGSLKGFAKKGAEAAASVAGNKLKQILEKHGVRLIGGYLANVAGEAAQEGAQQVVSIANRDRGVSGDGSGIPDLFFRSIGTGADILTGKNPDGLDEVADAAAQGAKIAAMMGGATILGTQAVNRALGTIVSSPEAVEDTVQTPDPEPAASANLEQTQADAREAAILRILEENGVTGTPANRQAQGVAALIDGGELSSNRADEIRKSRAAQAAYTQITGETIDTTGRPAEVRARIKQMALDKAAERNAQNVVETIPTQAAVETATQESTEAPVTPVTTMGTVDTNQAETSPVIQYTPSPASDLDTISQRVSNINLVDRMAQDSQVLGEAGRAAAMTRYDGTTDPSGYYAGFMQAYNDGMNGKRNRQNSVLTKEQYNQAYNAGRTDSRAGLTREGAGLVRNASAVKLRDAGTIDALAKKLGVTVVAEDTISSPNGRQSGANGYMKGREIHISLKSEDPAMVVFKHEVTHYLQEQNAKGYQAFRDYAVQAMGEDEVRRVQDLYRSRNVDLTWDGAMDEVAANYTENLLTDEEAVRRLIRDDRNLAQKIMDAIKGLLQKVKGQEGAKLRQAERLWTDMFREIAGQEQADRGTMGVRYSEKGEPLYGREETEQTAKGSVRKNDTGRKDGGRENSAGTGGEGILSSVRMLSRGEKPYHSWAEEGLIVPEPGSVAESEARVVRGEYQLPVFVVKSDIFNRNHPKAPAFARGGQVFLREDLPEIGRGDIGAHEAGHAMKEIGYLPYLDFIEKTPELINRSHPLAGKILEHASKHTEVDLFNMSDQDAIDLYDEINNMVYGAIHAGRTEAIDIIRPVFFDFDAYSKELSSIHEQFKKERNNGARFSIKSTDSQGRQLTKEQQEYFRDSIIRDDKGHLMVMYHISDVDNISVFQSGNSAGIIYFSKSIRDAQKAARGSRSIYVCYLNIKNPVNTENNPFYWYEAEDSLRVANWKREGYDGVYVKDESGVSVAVFYPGQIKETENLNPTNTTDIRFSLRQENQRLRELNQYLREEISDPSVVRTSRNGVKKLASRLVSEYDSTVDKSDISAQLLSLYDFIANGKDASGNELTWTEVSRRAKEIAQDILSGAVAQGNPLYEEYADVRSYVKQQAIVVPKDSRGDFEQFGGWGEFRKRNAGRMKLMNDGLPSDVFYQELSSQWPELFPEDIANPADQMIHTAEVLQYLDAVYENPYQQEMDVYTRYLADEILESFYEVPQRTTYAQRQQLRQTKQAIRYEKRIDSLRQRQKERIADLRAQGRDRIKQAVAEQREESVKKLDALKRKYQGKEAATRDRREAAATRAKIQRHVKKLSQLLLRPSDKSHVPEALKKPVAALLESINLESQYTVDPKTGKRKKNGGGDPTKRTQAFQELRKVYAEIAGKGEDMVIDPSLFGSEADGIKGAFDAVIDMRDTRLSDMTQEQLETVWKVVRAVEHSITTAGRILSKTKYAATQDWARAVEQDTASRRSKRTLTEIGALKSLENPYTFFSHYGEAGHAVYRMLRNAQDKQQLMVDRIAQEVGKITDPKSVEQLEKTVHTFTTERGDSLTLSTAQVMELYELTKRKQAHEHLLKGGIVQPEIKSSKIRRGTNAVLLSEGDLANIIKVLSEEEMKLADALQGLTSGILADYGNEASMTAYGYKKFTGTDYWPIRTAKEGVHSSSENNQNNTRSIKNIGLSKPTVPHASNALDIPGIFTTFASHAGDMVDYAAWLVPMEDANRLFNYEYRDGQGNPTGRYVKGLLDRVGGAGSQEYWSRLMDNIQNGISAPMDDPMTRIAVKGIGSFKSAAVGGNLRVWLLQPTSLFRASFVLPAEDISRGLVKGATKGNGWKKALKYSPIAMRKDNGGFDISNPRSMKEQLFDGRSRIRKFNDALSAPAGIADAWAWGKLWNACEWTTARRHKELRAGSEAFYQKVNEMFTEVIDQTQVVDGILQRSNIMRSRNAIAQQATTFMGEPIMSLNMLLRAYDQFRYEQNPVKRGKAIKALGRASMALVLTSVASAVVQSFVDALRDDDKDKKHLERMLSAFTGLTGEEESAWEKAIAVVLNGNLIGNLNPIGQIPFARDILSQAQGYEVSRTDMEIFSDLVRATQTVIDSADGNGKRTRAYAVKELLSSAAKVFGTPVGNLTRDVWSIIRSFFIQTDNISLLYEMEKAIYNITNDGNRSRYVDILYRAYRSGESDTYESIYSDLVKNGMDPAKIASGMESRMKEDQGVTSVSDLEQRYLPPDKEKEYQSLLSGVSGTKIWAGATEEQRKNTFDDIYQLIMGTDRSASLRDKISAGSQYGLTEEEMVLYELAKEVASQDGNDNTSQEEAAAAAAMLPGLSDNERAYLWQSTNKGWKDTNNPWK